VDQRAALAGKGPIGGYKEAAAEVAADGAGGEGGDPAGVVVVDTGEAGAVAAAGVEEAAADGGGGVVGVAAGPGPKGEVAAAEGREVAWRYAPHMLAMSATPIPRTLALARYGEMALSCIDEQPAGRQPIVSKMLDQAGSFRPSTRPILNLLLLLRASA
jgi:hypothetical protein